MDENTQQLLAKVSQALGIKLEHLMALINNQEQQEEGGGMKFLDQVIQVLQSGDENAINGLRQQVMEALGVPSEKNGGILSSYCPPGTEVGYAKDGKKICKRCQKKAQKGEDGLEVENPEGAYSFLGAIPNGDGYAVDPYLKQDSMSDEEIGKIVRNRMANSQNPYYNTYTNNENGVNRSFTEGRDGNAVFSKYTESSTQQIPSDEFNKLLKEKFGKGKSLFDELIPNSIKKLF